MFARWRIRQLAGGRELVLPSFVRVASGLLGFFRLTVFSGL
jgi:hypothetical protein